MPAPAPQERTDALAARLRFVVARARDARATGVYVLPSTGKRIDFDRQRNGWKLSRLLYRVGELQLTELLADVLPTEELLNTEQDAHAFVRTLGIIGGLGQVAVVERVGERFAASALVQRTVAQTIAQLRAAQLTSELPRKLTDIDSPDRLASLLTELTTSDHVNDWLYPLYLHLHWNRPELLATLRNHLAALPHRGNYFRPLRYVLKAAEQFGDLPTLARLHHWVWRGAPESKVYEHRDWKQIDGRWTSTVLGRAALHPKEGYDWRNPVTTADMSQRDNTWWGFTTPTRKYFLRRLFRRLDQLGQRGEAAGYAQWATNFLLYLNGTPVRPAYEETRTSYHWDRTARRSRIERYQVYHPVAADVVPLHWIISGGERGFPVRPDGMLLESRTPYGAPRVRRERHPKCWDQQPTHIIRLLADSTLVPVQEFALRVYRDNPNFVSELTAEQLVDMLRSSNEEIADLSLDALGQRPELLTDAVAVVLIIHDREDFRNWAFTNVQLSFDAAFSLLLTTDNETHFERLLNWIRQRHAARLSNLTSGELDALTRQPLAAAGLLAAERLGQLQPVPYSLLLRLLTSEHVEVRAAGMELFGTLPVEELYANHLPTLTGMAVSERPEVRTAATPIIRRVAERYPDFGRELTTELLGFLRSRGKATDIHEQIAELLTVRPLQTHLATVPVEEIWALLRSRKFPTQRVGFAALQARTGEAPLTTAELVELGRHTWVQARAFAHAQLLTHTDRTRYEVADFLPLLDTHWEDSRTFAKAFLREQLTDRDWTPELLIRILDIPREDVQVFALEFVERYVGPKDATDFLLQASQHPGHRVQAFAADWLDRYAGGQPTVIAELEPFFRSVLGQISRGRLAKDRTFDFLEREGLADEPTARLVLDLLQRHMLTIAVGDRSRCWDILNRLRRRYPHLDSPLSTRDRALIEPKAA